MSLSLSLSRRTPRRCLFCPPSRASRHAKDSHRSSSLHAVFAAVHAPHTGHSNSHVLQWWNLASGPLEVAKSRRAVVPSWGHECKTWWRCHLQHSQPCSRSPHFGRLLCHSSPSSVAARQKVLIAPGPIPAPLPDSWTTSPCPTTTSAAMPSPRYTTMSAMFIVGSTAPLSTLQLALLPGNPFPQPQKRIIDFDQQTRALGKLVRGSLDGPCTVRCAVLNPLSRHPPTPTPTWPLPSAAFTARPHADRQDTSTAPSRTPPRPLEETTERVLLHSFARSGTSGTLHHDRSWLSPKTSLPNGFLATRRDMPTTSISHDADSSPATSNLSHHCHDNDNDTQR